MPMTRPHVLGLTGNIATGKSTVALMLAELGAEVIDCDLLAHEAMAPGTATNAAIAARFGGVQQADGAIDRGALGRIVFADPAALAELEALVHPAVLAEARRRLAAARAPVVVIEAIKLFESGLDRDCDEVLAVATTEETQLQRLMDHRGMSFGEAERRMLAQPHQEGKLLRADRVIDNSGSLAATWKQVATVWRDVGSRCGAPQPAARPELPASLRQPADDSRRRALIYWAILAVFFGVWMAINWINAGLSDSQKAFVLALCVLAAGACAWIVARW